MAEIARFMKADDAERRLKTTPTIMDCYKLTAQTKIRGVTEYVEHLLNNNIKFLIFGHHHIVLDAIEKKVKDISAGYIRIDGTTPPDRRHMYVAKFQADEATRVAILGITASSQGITLTAARTVIFSELSWVPGLMLQAEDRVHRIGQQEDVVDVHYCIAEGSIDDFIFASLNSKSKNTTAIQDGHAKHMDCYRKVSVPRADDSSVFASSSPGTPPASRRSPVAYSPAKRSKVSDSGVGGQNWTCEACDEPNHAKRTHCNTCNKVRSAAQHMPVEEEPVAAASRSQAQAPAPAPARRTRIEWSAQQEQQLQEAIKAYGRSSSRDCQTMLEDSRFPLLHPLAITTQQLTDKMNNMKKKGQLNSGS
jgi:hypothetical protein